MKVILEIPEEVLRDVQVLANLKQWSRKQYMQNIIIKDSVSSRSVSAIKTYKSFNEQNS